MESPGVTVTPIDLISGNSDFCQTFFGDVRVPKSGLISRPGHGWTVGKRLLQYERSSIGGIGGGKRAATLPELAAQYVGHDGGHLADAALRTDLIQLSMGERAFALTTQRTREEATTSAAPTFMSSFFKIHGTEQNKRRSELTMRIFGTQALGWEGTGFSRDETLATRAWLRSKANSIEGGSTEVMQNIIAKRVLDLPD